MERKLFGARISLDAIARIKLLARATGLGDGETVERVLTQYVPTPAEAKAIKALEEFDLAQAAFKPVPDLKPIRKRK